MPLPPFVPIVFWYKGVGLCGHAAGASRLPGVFCLSELGARANETNEAAVAENFVGDEFFGADRKLDMKTRRRASVKEVQKLSADAKKAVGSAGGPTYGDAGKRSRPSRRGSRAGSAAGGDRSSPPASLS